MFKQEDSYFAPEINHCGCCGFALLAACELVAGKQLTRKEIADLFAYGKTKVFDDWQGNRRLWIEANCSIVNPDAIAARALAILGSKKILRQVGALQKDSTRKFWDWANKPPYNDPDWLLLEFETHGQFGTHYVLADVYGTVIFDPSVADYTDRPILGGLYYKTL
jgi:hypothetical protein